MGINYQKCCLSKCYAFRKPYGSGFLCLISDWCYTSAPPPSQIPDYSLVACTSNIEEISLISSISMISEETAMMIFLLKSLLLYGQISVVMHTVQALIFKVLPRIRHFFNTCNLHDSFGTLSDTFRTPFDSFWNFL